MTTPLFTPTAPCVWRANPITRGPFDGMQGGAVAALLCALIEKSARDDELGFVASTVTSFIRPTPVGDLEVAVTPLRVGRRISFVDAIVSAEGKITAVQRATCIKGAPHSGYPQAPPITFDLSQAVRTERTAPAHGQPYMMDAMERLETPDGVVWFRLSSPVIGAGEQAANILPAADWAHGLGPPQGAKARPPSRLPNADLSVQLLRPAEGEWIGLAHGSAWSDQGIGVGFAELRDARGLLGRVSMSVAVTLL